MNPVKNLWVKWKTHFFSAVTHTSPKPNMAQILYFALMGGVIGSLVSSAYFFLLELLVSVIWKYTFEGLKKLGTFSDSFPEYNFIWMGSLPYIVLVCIFLKIFASTSPGGFSLAADKIHTDGKIPLFTALPLVILSLLSLASGSGLGPEAPILGLGGVALTFVGEKLGLPKVAMRTLVLTGISAALASFFGSPLSGLFALEFSHRIGIEYYEALIPSTLASFVGTIILQGIFQRPFGSFFTFHENLEIFAPKEMLIGALLGVFGAIASFLFYLLSTTFVITEKKLRLERFKYFLPLVAWVVFSVGGMLLPPILFWGEPELENILHENQAPLYHWRGNSSGIINLGTEEGGKYPPLVVFLVAIVKLCILPFNTIMNLKGGIVFPLFFIGGTLGQGIHMITGIDQALAVCCMMAAVQSGVTRTPFGSTFVAVFNTRGPNSQLIIPVLVASFVSVILTYKFPLFPTQRSREDIIFTDHDIHHTLPIIKVNEGDAGAVEHLMLQEIQGDEYPFSLSSERSSADSD